MSYYPDQSTVVGSGYPAEACAKQTSPAEAAFGDLDMELAHLQGVIDRLASRLQIVLVPPSPRPEAGSAVPNRTMSSVLVEGVRGASNRVMNARMQLDNLIESLTI
jgi:hypothetical protein